MKRLVLKEILLLSSKQKAARRISFDPKRTLIIGGNHTGKSTLLKSIYKTFGASVSQHPNWTEVDPVSLIEFKVDNTTYYILKDADTFSIFDSKKQIIKRFKSVTNDLSPYFSELFNFKLKLANRKSEHINATPAFLFLPFYIDQDKGWKANWDSFEGLKQFKAYRDPTIFYHTGIRPNEYYNTKGEIEVVNERIKNLDVERKSSVNIKAKLSEQLSNYDFNIDISQFEEEIKALLIECNKLREKENVIKEKLVDLYNHRSSQQAQLEIVKSSIKELKKDYKMAMELEHAVNCPTCGAEYENSFIERFEIALDEDRCVELARDLEAELSKLDKKITDTDNEFKTTKEEILAIEKLLETRKEQIKLADLIENMGTKHIRGVLSASITEIDQNIGESVSTLKRLQELLKSFEDKEKKERILTHYEATMAKYLKELDVRTLSRDVYKKITTKVPEQGSALPRALIAYYYSILEVIRKNSTSTFCPMIIDSPNQQAQDDIHLKAILEFISSNQPQDSQLILGLETALDVDFNCKTVELTDKYNLLQKSEFEEIENEMTPFLTQSLFYTFD